MTSYSNPDHPEHKSWLISRRKRFEWILREGKRACRLMDDERELVKQLADILKMNTKKLEGK